MGKIKDISTAYLYPISANLGIHFFAPIKNLYFSLLCNNPCLLDVNLMAFSNGFIQFFLLN